MAGLGYTLHEVQADGADEVVKGASWDAETGTVSVPAHTVAVFVAGQGTGEDGKRTGPPEHAGQKGRPAHAGEQGPPAHSNGKAKGRAAGEG